MTVNPFGGYNNSNKMVSGIWGAGAAATAVQSLKYTQTPDSRLLTPEKAGFYV